MVRKMIGTENRDSDVQATTGLFSSRVLFLTGAFPFPVDNGSKLRSSVLLRAMTDIGFKIHLVAFGKPEDTLSPEANGVCRAITVIPHAIGNLSTKADYFRRLASLGSKVPYGTRRYSSKSAKQVVELAISSGAADFIVCDTLDCMINIPDRCPLPLVLNNHNVEHLILERFIQLEKNPLRRFYGWQEALKLRSWERASAVRADVTLVCSDYDRAVIRSLDPSTSVAVVPNVVDTDQYVPVEVQDSCTLIYTGGMDWYPNRDAVQYFCACILPKIREKNPKVHFVVAGRNPSPEFLKLFANIDGIEFTGTVDDIRPQIARAAICVVPLRIGSGTRLKILEAAAMGKPIVSTSLGAEGLTFVDGHDIVIADEPDQFSLAVLDLLADSKRRFQMGQAARERATNHYSYLTLRKSLIDALGSVNGGALIESARVSKW